jgi:hypothetical protein
MVADTTCEGGHDYNYQNLVAPIEFKKLEGATNVSSE